MTQAPEDYPAHLEDAIIRLRDYGHLPLGEKSANDVAAYIDALLAFNASLRAVMGELVEALKFYADIKNHLLVSNAQSFGLTTSAIDFDEGFIAREALSRANQSNSKR